MVQQCTYYHVPRNMSGKAAFFASHTVSPPEPILPTNYNVNIASIPGLRRREWRSIKD